MAKAIIGHSTDTMREHYSTVDVTEKRQAMTKVARLVKRAAKTRERAGNRRGNGGSRKKRVR